MYNFTIPMALMDFLPVVFFGIAAALLQRDLYNKMSRDTFTLFASGTVNIFAAGFLKALWKLLYTLNICDFQALYTMFLPVQSLGFLLAGTGILLMLCKKKRMLAAPPVFGSSLVFIIAMSLGLGTICTCLSIVAVKMKKKGAAAAFILSFLFSMGMGALAGQDMTLPWVNWAEQGINTVGQGLLLWGVLILHEAGLYEYQLQKGE